MTLDEIEARIHGGEAMLECAWESLREQNFPGRDPEAAAAQLGKWALSRRIEVEFDHCRRADGEEAADIHVLFTAADPLFWPRLLHAAAD